MRNYREIKLDTHIHDIGHVYFTRFQDRRVITCVNIDVVFLLHTTKKAIFTFKIFNLLSLKINV